MYRKNSTIELPSPARGRRSRHVPALLVVSLVGLGGSLLPAAAMGAPAWSVLTTVLAYGIGLLAGALLLPSPGARRRRR